jgi:hypothetical protein
MTSIDNLPSVLLFLFTYLRALNYQFIIIPKNVTISQNLKQS